MKFVFVSLLVVFSLAVSALAQTQIRTGAISGGFSSVGAIFAGGAFPGGAVTGAPYSAEQVTEQVQTLADGTHITQPPAKTMFYRDSQGRTRIEHTFPLPPGVPQGAVAPPSLIEINDPVSGAHYTLDERRHTATKFSFPTVLPVPAPNSAIRPAKLLALAPAPSPWFSPVVVQPAASSEAPPREPQVSHESLGAQTIEGVLAEGTRTTMTFPVGAVGNDRPITTVEETWTSPELKVIVLSKNSDPRSGESTTRLTNISRAEPDAALFQVPPDYQVLDQPSASPAR